MQEIRTTTGTRIQLLSPPEYVKDKGATLHVTNDERNLGRVVNVFLTEKEMLELGKSLVLESVRISETNS